APETETRATAAAPDTRGLTSFDRIEVGGIYALDIEVGPAFSVALSGSPYMLERARARVVDGVLQLEHESNLRCERRDECDAVRARITLPALNGLSISGVSEGSRVAGIDAERFAFDIDGVGEVVLSGRCGAFDLEVSGVGDIDAAALQCADVDAEIAGVGDVEVYASRSIDAEVGIGDLIVHGSPQQVVRHSDMLGEITIR
ncbi:MAG: DUF2807 domain-containing protein, partial [Sphingomonadaceae bacterium]|nr:DUF2807 domain-containing protein [Sphingomonadaceae bacterium]